MHEDGIGMARTFEQEFAGHVDPSEGGASSTGGGTRRGFFAAADAPPNPTDYRTQCSSTSGAPESPGGSTTGVLLSPRRAAPIGILSGAMGARVLAPLVDSLGRHDVRIIPVVNEFFGGNTAVTGLMVGDDIARVLRDEPAGHRYLLPDVCLSDDGRFLDGGTVGDLPHPVEVIATDGRALRDALGVPVRRLVGSAHG